MKRLGWLIGGGLATGLAYSFFIEPEWIEVRRLDLTLPRLHPAFEGYRLAQFSDIHMDSKGMSPARLMRVVEMINREAPDLVAFTGDFVTRRAVCDVSHLIPPLRALRARDGVAAVMGNHEFPISRPLIHQVIREAGLTLLNNRVLTLNRADGAQLHIAGVDSLMRRRARLDRVLRRLPRTGAAILLAHEPDTADLSAATRRFDLQLSGHSHGGQIRVPFLTQFALPTYGQRYRDGLWQISGMMLYVNRGIGMTGLPLRFNCRPEITIFTLHAKPARQPPA